MSPSPRSSRCWPLRSVKRTFTRSGRVTFSTKSGIERQPSSSVICPSISTISGLMKTCRLPGFLPTVRSITASRFPIPIWFAASPTPGAAYIVSTMSSISFCSAESISPTGCVGLRKTGSPYLTMGRTDKVVLLLFLQTLDHRLDRMLGAALIKVVEHLADSGIHRQRVVEFFLIETKQFGALRRGDRRRARLAGEHAHLAEE